MQALKEGQAVPEVTFIGRKDNQWNPIKSTDLFNNRKVILFALPGAFTPTCSSTHLPRYNALASTFKQEGVDEIVCLSVNDGFVMESWGENLGAQNITLLPDGNGEFSKGMGMLVDKAELGFGPRSWRYSMLVNNGVIEKMFIEAEEPGDPFKVSDADTMLNYINPEAKQPAQVSLFSKPGCPHCERAKAALKQHNMDYEEILLGQSGISYTSLSAITGQGTTPQVYINGAHIGSADQLEEWLDKAGK